LQACFESERPPVVAFHLTNFSTEVVNSDHDMTEQLAAISVAESRRRISFIDLAEVVGGTRPHQQFGIEFGVPRPNSSEPIQSMLNVWLSTPPWVGVVIASPQRRRAGTKR